MKRPQKIIIVGGGIGGMALAAALQRVGLSATVLEQAPQLGEVGSGLGVLPGAVRALRALGVSEELFTQAAPLQQMRIANHRGRDLVNLDLTQLFARLGVPGYLRSTRSHDVAQGAHGLIRRRRPPNDSQYGPGRLHGD